MTFLRAGASVWGGPFRRETACRSNSAECAPVASQPNGSADGCAPEEKGVPMAASETKKEIVVSHEDAVFWLDRWGHWCNAHGRFEHKKIIDYFHAAIDRDEHGYFVSQVNGDILEKVYFRYEDTALFVFDVIVEDTIVLVLNTRRQMPLDPGKLVICDDNLYVCDGTERIKFNQSSMMRMSPFLTDEGDACQFTFKGQRVAIPERSRGA
jgi:hypothetical protein